MRRLLLSAMAASSVAQVPPAFPRPMPGLRPPGQPSFPPMRRPVMRDLALEQSVLLKADQLITAMGPRTRAELAPAALALCRSLASDPAADLSPLPLAQAQVRAHFPLVPEASFDLLTFCVSAESLRLVAHPEQARLRLGAAGTLSDAESTKLQTALDRQGAFIAMMRTLLAKVQDRQVPALD